MAGVFELVDFTVGKYCFTATPGSSFSWLRLTRDVLYNRRTRNMTTTRKRTNLIRQVIHTTMRRTTRITRTMRTLSSLTIDIRDLTININIRTTISKKRTSILTRTPRKDLLSLIRMNTLLTRIHVNPLVT